MGDHEVRVFPLPAWLDAARLLGEGFSLEALEVREQAARSACAVLDAERAADLQARLLGVGLGGARVVCEVTPALPRSVVRKARLDEARRRREKSPGFTRTGARLDAQARLGLTPEALALAMGRRARRRFERVVDLCAGAGGSAIGFARAGCSVTAIERDEARVGMLRHNARLYGVASKIEIVHGDALDFLAAHRSSKRASSKPAHELWFVDPPWGGADGKYDSTRVGITDLPPLARVLAARPSSQALWAKLPPTFDVSELSGARARAVFGVGAGDAQRVKLVLLEL